MSVDSQLLTRAASAPRSFSVLPLLLRVAGALAALQAIAITGELTFSTRIDSGLTPGGRIVLVAALVVSALISCFLFFSASSSRLGLVASSTGNWPIWSRLLAPILALYAPFLWVVSSGWIYLWPLLPGFAFAIFVKHHGRLPFLLSSGISVALLILTVFVISTRFRFGPLIAIGAALLITVPTSFIAHWLLHG